MSSEKLLVVIGVTGQQGGSVARVFQSEPGWRIRGITRNPAKHPHLAEAGIELVSADLDESDSLDRAFAGADAIFSVTDFWQFLQPNSATFEEAAKAGRSPNELAMDKEVQQGKNIIDAAARAHAQKPLHRFVVSTLSDSKKWSRGEIQHNLHFDGKAHYVEYLQTAHPELAKRSSYVQIGYYMSNWKSFPMWTPKKAPGSEVITIPFAGYLDRKPIPFVDPPNDTGHFVRALLLSPKSPPGTTMLGYGEYKSAHEYTDLWSATLGVKAQAKQITAEDMVKSGIPDWLATEITQSGMYVTTYGWDGGEPGVKSPEEAGVDVSQLTKLDAWMKKEDLSSVM